MLGKLLSSYSSYAGRGKSICEILAIEDPESLAKRISNYGYISSSELATAIFLAITLQKPLLLEGDAGVGKTEVAKVLAQMLGTVLIRLQCYEGIDVSQALYEWNYSKQLLHLRSLEVAKQSASSTNIDKLENELYSDTYLIRRALLRALDPVAAGDKLPEVDGFTLPAVLLIDELDRADDEFEAFLLEVLSDYAVTIPELGTISAKIPPVVIITSNRTRDLHDALKRRCLYHWVDHPSPDLALSILMLRVPDADYFLADQVARLTQTIRDLDLYKPPGISESIDWLRALMALDVSELTGSEIKRSVASILKYREDVEKVIASDFDELLQSRKPNPD